METPPVEKEAHELAVIVSSSVDELERQHLDKVNLGQHVLAEYFECDSNILNNIDKVEKYMIDAERPLFKNVFICLTRMV